MMGGVVSIGALAMNLRGGASEGAPKGRCVLVYLLSSYLSDLSPESRTRPFSAISQAESEFYSHLNLKRFPAKGS